MTAESPWDDDRRFYGEDDFGDTYFEDEHYDPNDPGESSVDEVPRCTQCDRPVDPDQDLCEECEHDKELESENPYGPIHDDVSMTYEKRIDDLAFAVVPAFGIDPVFTGMQFALMVSMFLLLGVLTYYAGRAIENAEKAAEAAALEESAESDPEIEGTTEEPATLDDDGADAQAALEQTDDDA